MCSYDNYNGEYKNIKSINVGPYRTTAIVSPKIFSAMSRSMAETADFFKTARGKDFLSTFDYQKNGAGGVSLAQAPPSVGLPQDVYTDAIGNVISGTEARVLGNVAAAQQDPGNQ